MHGRKELLKIILVGEAEVGKTFLLDQFLAPLHRFIAHKPYKPTIGADFSTKEVLLDSNSSRTLQFWDTPGQEQYNGMGVAFYRGADAFLIVFDTTKPESFKTSVIENWMHNITKNIDKNKPPIFLIGNKKGTEIENAEAKAIAEQLGLIYEEVDMQSTAACKQLLAKVAQQASEYADTLESASSPITSPNSDSNESTLIATPINFWKNPVRNIWERKYVEVWNETSGSAFEKAQAVLLIYIATGMRHKHIQRVGEMLSSATNVAELVMKIKKIKHDKNGDLALALNVIESNAPRHLLYVGLSKARP